MIRAIFLVLAMAAPAYAQAPMLDSELECGTLVGKGSVRLVLGGRIKATIEIVCGVKRI